MDVSESAPDDKRDWPPIPPLARKSLFSIEGARTTMAELSRVVDDLNSKAVGLPVMEALESVGYRDSGYIASDMCYPSGGDHNHNRDAERRRACVKGYFPDVDYQPPMSVTELNPANPSEEVFWGAGFLVLTKYVRRPWREVFVKARILQRSQTTAWRAWTAINASGGGPTGHP